MVQQIPLEGEALPPEVTDGSLHQVLDDVAYQRLAIVNVMYLGTGTGEWVLVDAGVTGSRGAILKAVESRFGADGRPAAIVMTHGHFDHVGALRSLAERWDVPVYAHEMELPYLDGSSAYPPPDPSVGGGLMAASARLYPTGPTDVSPWLQSIPDDGTVPGAPGWRWLHTPGHTRGHISLWRASDQTLIAGDAVITTAQESAYAVATQKEELHGPPMYFTPDWERARSSARDLAALEPELLLSGHGRALQGPAVQRALRELADRFDEVAVPEDGRYVAP